MSLPARFFCFFLIVFAFSTSCEPTPLEKKNIAEIEKEVPNQEAFNITYIYSDSAVTQAKLTAPHVIERMIDKVAYSEFDQGMHFEFYGPDGKVESELNSEEGTVNLQEGIAEARGNVVVFTKKGEKIESEKLFWDKGRDMIWTPAFVKIRTKDEIIYGDSMEANTNMEYYKIFHTKGVIQIKDEEGL